MVTDVCMIWECCTTIHSDAHFHPKANLVDTLCCTERNICDASYVNNEVMKPRDHLAHEIHGSHYTGSFKIEIYPTNAFFRICLMSNVIRC